MCMWIRIGLTSVGGGAEEEGRRELGGPATAAHTVWAPVLMRKKGCGSLGVGVVGTDWAHRGSWAPRLTDASSPQLRPQPLRLYIYGDASLADDGCWAGCFALPCATHAPRRAAPIDAPHPPPTHPTDQVFNQAAGAGGLLGVRERAAAANSIHTRLLRCCCGCCCCASLAGAAPSSIWNQRQPQPNSPCWPLVLGVGGWLLSSGCLASVVRAGGFCWGRASLFSDRPNQASI